MKKPGIVKGIATAAVLLAALFLIYWLGLSGSGGAEPDYTMFSTNERGISLLYDTLKELKHPVAISYKPITPQTSINDAMLIIEPSSITQDDIDGILSWVRRGGRLVYMDTNQYSLMAGVLAEYESGTAEQMSHYYVGMGTVVTLYTNNVINEVLMVNTQYGQAIRNLLTAWHPDNVYFMEYYHGYQQSNSLLAVLPEGLRLAIYQIAIAAAAVIWMLGKRFGKPIPYYEEIERDENEHVIALARLYEKTGNNKGS